MPLDYRARGLLDARKKATFVLEMTMFSGHDHSPFELCKLKRSALRDSTEATRPFDAPPETEDVLTDIPHLRFGLSGSVVQNDGTR